MKRNQLLWIVSGLTVLILLTTRTGLFAQKNIKKVGPQPDGSVLVPSNQLLRPAGFQVFMPGRPVDLALVLKEKYLVVKNMKSVDLVRISDRAILQTLPFQQSGSSFTGICSSKNSDNIYVTDAESRILVAGLDKNNLMSWKKPYILPQASMGGDPVPGGLALNSTGDRLYVTESRSNALAVINLQDSSITEIPVGMAPYDVVLKSDSRAYVANWGGRRPKAGETTYNSSDSQVLVDPKTGVANSGSVSVVDLKTNQLTGEIEVGLHPSGMVFSPDRSILYVACANSDVISVIDTETDKVVRTVSVHRDPNLPFGSGPNSLAISPDGRFLYVANGTENAVCVIETAVPEKITGLIPTGWYPGAVITDSSGKWLFVTNVKGNGSRNQRTDRAGYNSHDHLGSVSILPVPDQTKLEEMTAVVKRNNSLASEAGSSMKGMKKNAIVPVPWLPAQKSVFKHVVYIIKENRTYDQVFSDLHQGNGDTSLIHFGRLVTPNHHKLAETFVLLDNFYCSGVLSADGHQWTDEAYVTDYLEKSFGDFTRSYPYDGDDAMAYAGSGFIWDNVMKHGLTFRSYGEFVNASITPRNATFSEILKDFQEGTGKISIRAEATLEQIKPYICPTYIGFPGKVPDVYRASEFIKELKEFEKNGNFPNLSIMLLPNDHTSGTSPGMPTPRAAVADNDLALGQIVEAISNSRFWKETCILVTEDDPQAGLDHVDGHRTVGLVISPYTKRGEVISTYYSQVSMVRTIENILGIPPMNQLDQASEAMVDCFRRKPDFTPYKALKNNIALNELNPPLHGLVGQKRYWAEKSMEQNLEEIDRIDEDQFNRIIWHSVRGYDKPYPMLSEKKEESVNER